MTTINDWLNVISNTGFPIAVAAYLLIRVEAKLGQLSAAIAQLREAIITLPARDCPPAPASPPPPRERKEFWPAAPPPATAPERPAGIVPPVKNE